MKAFILIFCFCLLSVVVFAQNPKIDSLKKVIATTKVDTVKGRTMSRVAFELMMIGDYTNSILEAEKGLQISKRCRDNYGIAKCYETLIESNLENTEYEKCLKLCDSMEILAKLSKNKSEYNYVLLMRGNTFVRLGKYQESIRVYEQLLQFAIQQNDIYNINNANANMGVAYRLMGNYPKALSFYHKSIVINEKQKNYQSLANDYANIGALYIELDSQAKALSFTEKSLKINRDLENKHEVANDLLAIAAIYYNMKYKNKAMEYYRKSIQMQEELADKDGLAYGCYNFGLLLQEEGNFEEALPYLKRSLALSNEISYKEMIINSNYALATYYHSRHQFNLSYYHIREGLRLSLELNALDQIRIGYLKIYQADSALGDYKSAFEHHKLFKQYSDSLHNEDKAKEFGRVESKYQFEMEAEEAKRKEAEAKRVAQIERDRSNNLQYLSIFAGLLVLFGSLAFVGKLKIPARVLDITLFAALLISFEFLLILTEPYIEQYSGGIPIQKLVFNSVIALGFAPLHGFLEGKLKSRFGKNSE